MFSQDQKQLMERAWPVELIWLNWQRGTLLATMERFKLCRKETDCQCVVLHAYTLPTQPRIMAAELARSIGSHLPGHVTPPRNGCAKAPLSNAFVQSWVSLRSCTFLGVLEAGAGKEIILISYDDVKMHIFYAQ